MKKLFNTFGDLEHCKKAMREIRMLSHFDQENILSLRDLIVEGEDVYMVTDLLDTDLHKIIKFVELKFTLNRFVISYILIFKHKRYMFILMFL